MFHFFFPEVRQTLLVTMYPHAVLIVNECNRINYILFFTRIRSILKVQYKTLLTSMR